MDGAEHFGIFRMDQCLIAEPVEPAIFIAQFLNILMLLVRFTPQPVAESLVPFMLKTCGAVPVLMTIFSFQYKMTD
jgi:hypothetical protein